MSPSMRRLLNDETSELFEPVRFLLGAAIAFAGYLISLTLSA